MAIRVHLFGVTRFEYNPVVVNDLSQSIMQNTNANMYAALLNAAPRNKKVEQRKRG